MDYTQDDIIIFLIFLLLFWLCLNVLGKIFKLEKRGWEIGPVWFLAKTTRLNRFINKVAKRMPRFWRIFWTIGIVAGFISMGFIMIWLGINLYALITAPQPENAVVPFIPGVTVTGLPLLYMLIPIAIIMLCHELAHGIAARIDGVKVKSSGVLALILLPGAFVELDDEQAAKKSRRTRQRIYAAGSFSNLALALFSLILIVNMYSIGEGALLYHVLSDGPSSGSLQTNEIILLVNGTPIRDQWHLSEVLDQFKPFESVPFTVRAENGTIVNRTIITGFNRSATYSSWESLSIYNGTITNGNLDNLSVHDQNRLTLNSTNSYLNFSLFLNLTAFNVPIENFTSLILDLEILASINTFNESKVYLINFSTPSQSYEMLSLQNLQIGANFTGNITQSAGYNISHYINNSNYLALNFIFNSSSNFSVEIDLCKFYLINNQTKSYYGIITTYNIEDRLLATVLGPLAPHVNKMLTYLYMFSFMIGLVNLLPIPPFDGDKLFVSLFDRDLPDSDRMDISKEKSEERRKNEKPTPKQPWDRTKTFIWTIRGLAIFFFLSNIIISLLLFDITTLFSSILF